MSESEGRSHRRRRGRGSRQSGSEEDSREHKRRRKGRSKFEIKVLVPRNLIDSELETLKYHSHGRIDFEGEMLGADAVLLLRGNKNENLECFELIQRRIGKLLEQS